MSARTRCSGCNVPSTSSPLYCSGRRVLCGMCLWGENADLKRRIRLARTALYFQAFESESEEQWEALKTSRDLLDLRRPVRKGKRR